MILGDGAVGKTSMINRYMGKSFSQDHITTIGLDYVTKKHKSRDGKTMIPVKIWDTAGQERFKTITYSFYRKADGIIITYDVTNTKSFKNIQNWVESIREHAGAKATCVLVGNKIDCGANR